MRITDIWRFPVKSLQGERISEVHLGVDGIHGDRAWSLVNAETGLHLTARREPQLLYATASVIDDEVVVTLPDGKVATDDAALSNWLGYAVELRRAAADTSGTFETTLDEAETGDWVQWTGATGSFHDSTRSKVSLVSESTMGDWDRRRFRINIITDGADEIALVGGSATLGHAVVSVTKQIDRCVMVSRPQPARSEGPALERDLDVLRTINRERDTFLGVGALITTPGRIAVGDMVTTVDSQPAGDA